MQNKDIVLDIETSTTLAHFFGGLHDVEISVDGVERPSFLLCVSYQVLGEIKVHNLALPDFPGYKRHPYDDRTLVEAVHKLISSAKTIIAHNGKRFDIKILNGHFFRHGIKPPPPVDVVDTLSEFYRNFRSESAKLQFIAKLRNIGQKKSHEGIKLWLACENGDLAAWKRMIAYNNQDVRLLSEVYSDMLPWINRPSNSNGTSCPNCGSSKYQSRGVWTNKQATVEYARFHCNSCGKWFRDRHGEKTGVEVVGLNSVR